MQVNLQRNLTVEGLIKDRATSMQQLKTNPALHYGKTKIDAVSEAARTVSSFQTVWNIRPTAVVYDDDADSFLKFERVVFTPTTLCPESGPRIFDWWDPG